MLRARFVLSSMAAVCVLLCSHAALGSYGIYVGKNLTADGSVLLGGTGDEPSSHWLEIVPRKIHAPDETIEVGATKEANYPGELIRIPQVPVTARYITMNYSEFVGLPAPLTNGGLNEYGVAARDIWSPTRKDLAVMTPNPQHGVNYSDLSRIVMERAHSAREAVEIVGRLIEEYGYATYGGNSHLFADAKEGWILIDFAGGQGLWVAERLGPDDIRVSHPGYILEIPLDFQKHPDRFLGSRNFISFAVEHGWYDPHSGKPFSVDEVYQLGRGRSDSVKIMEERLRQKARTQKITLRDFMDAVRDPILSADWNGYGQVAHLRQGVSRPELNMLWVSATGSITTPFVPYWIGVDKVPPEYGKHRYLSHAEETSFVTKDFQIQEASQFAYITFKRLMYYTCDKPEKFLPEVSEAITTFENQSMEQSRRIEATATKLYSVGETQMGVDVLTNYSTRRAADALSLGNALLGSIEARHRLLYGYRAPVSAEMSTRGHRWGVSVDCRRGQGVN